MKCHRFGDQGERVGPELTGVGGRFARAYIIESILDPSRTIAPSFDTISMVLDSGLVVTGVKVSETNGTAGPFAGGWGRLPAARAGGGENNRGGW
jgi:quinoprotein glucose dehydrogenase